MRKFLLLFISWMTVGIALAAGIKHPNSTLTSDKMDYKPNVSPVAKGETQGVIKVDPNFNENITEYTITLRNGKSVTTRFNTPAVTNDLQESRSEETVKPTITFTYPDDLDIRLKACNVSRIDGESGLSFAFTNFFEINPESVDLFMAIRPGKYVAYAIGLWETEESFGDIYAHTVIEVTFDTESINIDFTKCTNEISMKMEMPNGEPFPEPNYETGEVTDVEFIFAWDEMSFGSTTYTDVPSMIALTDNFDEGITYTGKCVYTELETSNIIVGEAVVYSPFTGNVEEHVTADQYQTISQDFCLSESEKSTGYGGLSFTKCSIKMEGVTNKSTQTLAEEGIIPQNTVTAQYAKAKTDKISSYALGVVFGYNENYGEIISKIGGARVDFQDKSVFIPTNIYGWVQEDGSYGIMPTVDALIHPVEKVTHPWFYCPMIPKGDVSLSYYYEDNTIAQIGVNMNLLGAANEVANPTDILGCLRAVRYNGEKIEPVDLLGKEIWGSKYEFDFENSEFLMMDEYSYTMATTVGYELPNADTEDLSIPVILGYSMADVNGYITPNMKPDEAGTFAIVTYDLNNYWEKTTDYTVEFAMRANGSEEWIAVPCDEETDEMSGYRTSTVNLGAEELEEDTFYDMQVTATDAAGNFIKSSISPAFYYGANLGIAKVESNGDVVSSSYVDLLGRPASANTEGMLIRTDRLSDGSTRTVKVLNR